MKYKGIIFDLDGVIVSTDDLHYKAWKELADKLEIPFDMVKNGKLRGMGRMESLEILLSDGGKEYSTAEKQKLADDKNAVYRGYLVSLTPASVHYSVIDTLSTLRTLGLKMAIGSSSKNAKYILELIGLNGFFDVVADGSIITYAKPNPEVFMRAADMLLMLPSDCLIVEDSIAGIDAAVNGGFDSAAIGDAALCGKATYTLNELSDLVSIVKGA